MTCRNPGGDYALRLSDFGVSRCIVDFAFTLHLVADAREAHLRIEVPFQVSFKGATLWCDPEHEPEGLGPALASLHRSVQAATIAENGVLRVLLTDGLTLLIPRNADFESWTLNGPDGLLIVAGPAERLSIFPPPSAPGA